MMEGKEGRRRGRRLDEWDFERSEGLLGSLEYWSWDAENTSELGGVHTFGTWFWEYCFSRSTDLVYESTVNSAMLRNDELKVKAFLALSVSRGMSPGSK